MAVALDPQLALDEKAVEDPDLLAALERHLRAKQDVAEAAAVVKAALEDIQRELAKHPKVTVDTALRVGRFRLSIRLVEASHREFDVAEREQLKIGLVGDDGEPVKRSYRPRRPKAAKDTAGDEALEPRAPLPADADLRPAGEMNADALAGEAERSIVH